MSEGALRSGDAGALPVEPRIVATRSSGVVGAIPARYGSSRLPGKPLRLIAGRPMIEYVVRQVEQVPGLDRVVVLTDDERILAAVMAFGGEAEMTPTECVSGTDRIAFAARRWDCRAVINIQGDEPLINPSDICTLVDLFSQGRGDTSQGEIEMATLSAPASEEHLHDADKVKVVTGLDGNALYFSRAAIPWQRTVDAAAPRLHVGIYGYRRDVLLRLAELPPSPLERAESLEQLRALENGIRIRVLALDQPAHAGVDTEADLQRVASYLEIPPAGIP